MKRRLLVILFLLSTAPADAACYRVTLTGPVEDVTCFLGNCRGWIHSGSGYNAQHIRVTGKRLQAGQTITRTQYVCGG